VKKNLRYTLSAIYILASVGLFFLFSFILFPPNWNIVLTDFVFWITILLYFATINEFYHWAKNGRSSEMSDLVAIGFFFFLILLFTRDPMTSLMGSFSIYLWVGIAELKDYPVINKILIISLVTYNVIFIAGVISTFVGDPFILNTTFAFSFWIILGLGFILFGRKYIVVWRFLSPAYLTLFLYIIAWLLVGFINQYTPLKFATSVDFSNLTLFDLIMNIYFILILVNWFIYFISGPILDKLLGIKRVKDENLIKIVQDVKKDIGVKGKVKVGFGQYPILNAMAYGSILDQRIAIIAEEIDQIPEDELKGIVAHELSHTKGKHTLILTLIETGDLIMRMLLGLPATYYDYTFGNPSIPLIGFIILNLGIYMILFIFVRVLEGKADLMTKKAGYTKELAKALYNLESFYASGREIGLNTMLLCDEKITKDNQLLDYIDTARYISNSMIQPSRASLLGNLINSHPPTYFRIAAILSEELKPGKEAILPFICLKRSKQRKYAKKFEKARDAFKNIANEKFKTLFDIENISSLMKDFKREELFRLDLNDDFIFRNKITNEYLIGRIQDIEFMDSISDIDQFMISEFKTNEPVKINSSFYSSKPVGLDKTYFFQKDQPLILQDIELNDDKKDGNYIFIDKNQNRILKPINKTKLPNSMNIIENFKDNDVFIKIKSVINIYKCINVIPADNYDDYELELIKSMKSGNDNHLRIKLGELIISPRKIYLGISRNVAFKNSEKELINWLLNKQLRTVVYLKKPVNNLEIGYIQEINLDIEKIKSSLNRNEDEEENSLKIRNIFGKEKLIPYKTLEMISFQYETAVLQKKSETSFLSKLGYKLVNKFRPQKILYLNK
jgi:Zn-dependent protease with chaperone function